jgi:hypothetical protein
MDSERQAALDEGLQIVRPLLLGEAVTFEAQAVVTRGFWPDAVPSGTDWKEGIAETVPAIEACSPSSVANETSSSEPCRPREGRERAMKQQPGASTSMPLPAAPEANADVPGGRHPC